MKIKICFQIEHRCIYTDQHVQKMWQKQHWVIIKQMGRAMWTINLKKVLSQMGIKVQIRLCVMDIFDRVL
jgi:hypothetical protein